jgi:hypothetical protein
VQRKLKDIQRKTRNQDKEERKAAKSLGKIERAALEAYTKDKEANPDISLKIQQYEEYAEEQRKKEEGSGGIEATPTASGSQPKILHRDEKKVKKDEQVMEQLAKGPPAYNPKGGWKSITSTKVRVDMELPSAHHSSGQPRQKKSKYDFQERTVASLQPVSLSSSSSSSSPFVKSELEAVTVAFKKRKFGNASRRRQDSDEEH